MATESFSSSYRRWLGKRQPLDVLNGRRFTVDAVLVAAAISEDTLSNYLRSNVGLELCSDSPGRGRSRQFCLVDVYQLALLGAFARLTSRVFFVAKDLNSILLLGPGEMIAAERDRDRRGITDDLSDSEVWSLFCKDIYRTPRLYHHRDTAAPLFVYSDPSGISFNAGPNPFTSDPGFHNGIVVNATYLFAAVDQSLCVHLFRTESNV